MRDVECVFLFVPMLHYPSPDLRFKTIAEISIAVAPKTLVMIAKGGRLSDN